MNAAALDVRALRTEDRAAVLDLLRASLGWSDDVRHEALFEWKHDDNPFGPSPAWVATDGERVVGLRILMRWNFEHGGDVVSAVRAVDTATHPDYQGRGVFSRLTREAVDELTSAGIAFVFNTPNRQSRPGYLKLGWKAVGRLPVAARPRSVRALARMLRARVPAARWSLPSSAGVPAAEALADGESLAQLLAARPPTTGLRTHITPSYLRWRYCSPVIDYRAAVDSGGVGEGVAFFRVRARGSAREAVLGDVLARDHQTAQAMVRRVQREVGADYVIGSRAAASPTAGLIPIPRQGPLVTWRALASHTMPAPRQWQLTLGDVELF